MKEANFFNIITIYPTLEKAKTLYVQSNETKFAYRIFGSGFPIVLFQRFRGTIDDWDPAFINKLAEKNKVIVFDNVGIGHTNGSTPSDMEEIAKDALRFISALGFNSVNILGWSIGGLLAQVFALKYPSIVKKLILVGTGPAASNETIFPSDKFMNAAKTPLTTPELYQILFFTEDEDGKREMMKSLNRIESIREKTAPLTKSENWMSQLIAARSFLTHPANYFSRLKNIDCPVLVGGAKQDIAFPMIDSYLLARDIPNSKLIVYSNAAHAFHHQYFDHFGTLINNFLSE